MVDRIRRKTIISVGSMLALPVLSVLPSAVTASVDKKNSQHSRLATEQKKSELNIELLPDDASPVMRVTNTSDKSTILRKIHLGIVQAGGKTYDLNRSLISGAYEINAGQSQLIPLIEAGNTPVEPVLSDRYGQMPMKTATLETSKSNKRRNNTISALFA